MPREAEGFREQLARLDEKFPAREAITLIEAMSLLGTCRSTLMDDKTFPKKKTGGKWIVALVPLAQWLCKS